MRINSVTHGRIKNDGNQGIKIRLEYRLKTTYIHTGLYINPPDFKSGSGQAKPSCPDFAEINAKINGALARYNTIIKNMGDLSRYGDVKAIRDILVRLEKRKTIVSQKSLAGDFMSVAAGIITSLRAENRNGHASSIEGTINRFKEFFPTLRRLGLVCISNDRSHKVGDEQGKPLNTVRHFETCITAILISPRRLKPKFFCVESETFFVVLD